MSQAEKSILKLDLPLSVVMAHRRMAIGEILSLAPGTMLQFPTKVDEPVELWLDNKKVGLGRPVKVGSHYGVRVISIGETDGKLPSD